MPNYSYTAKSLQEEPKSGVLEAKDEHELAKILRQEGYILVSAKILGQVKKDGKFTLRIPFLGGVSLSEKLMFTRNLRIMITAGISLPRSLNTLSIQTKNKKFKKVLIKIADQITEGKSFSENLTQYPDIFSELYCSMVKVGEESGTMENVLQVLAQYMERDYELKNRIKGALIYPAVILAAMILIGILMLIVVVPKLAQTFVELGIELPLTTRIVITLGNFLAKFWYTLPFALLFLIILFRAILKTNFGKLAFDSFILKTPLVSPVIKKINSAYTTRVLSSLITAGIPIVRAMEILGSTLVNIHYKKAIKDVSEEIKKGFKLSLSLGKYNKLYPILVIQMLEVGEETGETAEIMQKLAEFYEEEVARTTKNLSTAIEPILMLMIGAVVGFFAISMIQPMYSMIQSL